MFLLNSCLSLFTAALFQGHPFSRSYGVILPSSLTMLLPSALGFSPHPPVSVYGTGTCQTIAAFLGTWLTHFATLFRSASRLWVGSRFCLEVPSSACARLSFPRLCSPHASPQFCCHAVQESQPVVHRLRLTYPGKISFTLETLDIRPRGFPPLSRYSFRHSLLGSLHGSFRYRFAAPPMLLYQCMNTFPSFGVVFQPRTFSAQDLSTSELLRTL